MRQTITIRLSALATLCLSAPVLVSCLEAAEVAPTDPVIIRAGADWIPLQSELEIEPGSALDFSALGFVDAPAGRHGRVIARSDGQFAFADSPGTPRRFYGVNLCFGAQYLSAEESDRLARRLVRLGYNALRIHHYERDLVEGQSPTTRLNPRKLEQLDTLLAAMIRHGIYLTTDLYVSRSVPWREVGIDRDGQIPMDTFKILVPVHAGAFDNWKQFTRAFLDHVNPHTQRRYADEPALSWLSLINEGNFGNFFPDLRTFPEWARAWNTWLTKRYADRPALAAVWKNGLKSDEDPVQGNVDLPASLSDPGLRVRDCIAFLSDTEREMVQRMKAYLRDELGCHALVSNANSWTYFVTDQAARTVYDYVDDHFYVDHPQFLEGAWRLPSRCPNTSPLAEGATGGRSKTFTRLLDKPFTITEYNYSGPGRFRGVGGILTGAMGALQGWGGIWRFAYSHNREAMFNPARMGYFDLAGDPLSQAAERASLCLFLRGDLEPAAPSVALVMSRADLTDPAAQIPRLAPRWHWLAWITRVGTQVVPDATTPLPHDAVIPLAWQTPATAYPKSKVLALDPYAINDVGLWSALRRRPWMPGRNRTDPARRTYESASGQLLIDAPRDLLVLDTPRTAGGYAPDGGTVEASHAGVRVTLTGSGATVWVSALEMKPIRTSRRLLVTHLTDLQNTDIEYRETARQTLVDWGRLPHLIRSGRADIAIRLKSPSRYAVWVLAPSGRRLTELPCEINGDQLRFTAEVAADPSLGARMLYEVARR